jgi:hypothetical protein
MDDARDIIGKTVLIKLKSSDGIEFTGIESEGPFFCKAKAVDEAGIWVENSRFMTVELRDAKGKSVPEKKRKPKKHTVNILLPWSNIQTVIMFEEDEGSDLGAAGEILEVDEQSGRIGFIK